MIINVSKSGNMCNQLIQMIHISAIALESNQKIFHMFQGDLRSTIDFSKGKKYGIYVPGGITKKRIWAKARVKIEQALIRNNYNQYAIDSINNASAAEQKMLRSKLYFNNSWYIRDYHLIEKYRPELAEVISPYDDVIKRIKGVFTTYREQNNNTILVGAHMRRGDYRTWQNGEFYFTDEEWNSLFLQMSDFPQFASSHLKFLIFSNEKVERENFSNQLDICVSQGTVAEDLAALSLCDFVLGPPSTFSWIANYIGRNRYYVIYDPAKEISYQDFSDSIQPEVTSYNIKKLKEEHA